MRNTVIWSFLSLVALATGGLVSGCDSDAKLARSRTGESCTKTADCEDNLKCVEGTCYPKSSSSGGSSNQGDGGDGTGATVTGPEPPVLGGEGESCTRAADCAKGLGCFSGRCTKDGGGEGGESSGGPQLGGIGESCGLTTDCEKGLACLPEDSSYYPDALALGGGGVCLPTDNGLEATGNVCGHECKTAEDCCELPFETHAAIGAESCAELEGLLEGVDCAAVTAGTIAAQRCFAKSAYCACEDDTWACEAGFCQYTASCSVASFNTPGGCPTLSRAGMALTSPCDTKAKKCAPAANEPVCKTDASCTSLPVTGGTGVCAAGECTCYKATGTCYRKCEEHLDCPVNYTCDEATSVCVAEPTCEGDAECVTRLNNINAKCFADGMCDTACNNDRDCNYGALTYGADTRVCNAEHRCVAVGCTEDSECPGTANGVRLFCGEKVVVDPPAGVTSAITD
jgi:hypothetical protein